MRKNNARLSSKAIRRGDTFCSPYCGRGCTIHEYRRALKLGTKLSKALGSEWKPQIWENLGWHYCATLGGAISVYTHGVREFWATTTMHGNQHHATGKTPTEAVLIVMKEMDQEAKRLKRTSAAIKKSL